MHAEPSAPTLRTRAAQHWPTLLIGVALLVLVLVPLHIGPRSVWERPRVGTQPVGLILARQDGVPLNAGAVVHPGETLGLAGVNFGDSALTVMVFATDAAGRIGWLLPRRHPSSAVEYANGGAEPTATPRLYRRVVVPELQPGPATVYLVISGGPLGTDRVERLAAGELTVAGLRETFGEAVVTALPLSVER